MHRGRLRAGRCVLRRVITLGGAVRAAIYQYWSGVRPPYSHVSERLFRDYAVRIGAQYHFGDGRVPIRCFHKRFFGALAPIWFDDFATYDAVLFADMDVIPVAGLSEDIFASLTGDLMMCEEPGQADLRADMRGAVTARNDLSWARAVRSFGAWGRSWMRRGGRGSSIPGLFFIRARGCSACGRFCRPC